jgi:2',3'-cyclic-nucleotide 2'-phosphodiesterase (5'-nucleotidase family)
MRPGSWCSALLTLVALGGCVAGDPPPRTLTILHTNDLHARLVPDDGGRGGFAPLAALIERECARAAACLVLDGGDLVQGSAASSVSRGIAAFDVANHLGLDASTLGNHEFDYGWEMIPRYREAARFPIVTANVVDPDGKLLADAAWTVLESSGVRVGVIGVLTEELPRLTVAARYTPWRVLPVVETVRRYLPEVARRADLVVVLGHLTDDEETALVSEVEGIAAVVSGHGHARLDPPRVVDGRVAVRVAAYGRELGRLELRLGGEPLAVVGWDWQALPVRAGGGSLPAAAARVGHWEAQVRAATDRPIGESRRAFSRQETREILERALRESTGADLGYVNPGGVRDDLPRGRLLARHVWDVMPFDNTVVVGEFLGRDLPRFLVEERGLEPGRRYRLATMDFVAATWRERGAARLEFEDTGRLVRDVVIDWIRDRAVLE